MDKKTNIDVDEKAGLLTTIAERLIAVFISDTSAKNKSEKLQKKPREWFIGKSPEEIIRHGLNEKALERRLGISDTTIATWLAILIKDSRSRFNEISVGSLKVLCEKLNVSADYILGISDNKANSNSKKSFLEGYVKATLATTNYWSALIDARRGHLDYLNQRWQNDFQLIIDNLASQEQLSDEDAEFFYNAVCAFVHLWDFGCYHYERLLYTKKAIEIGKQVLQKENTRLQMLLEIDAIGYTLTEIKQYKEAIHHLEPFTSDKAKCKDSQDLAPIILLAYLFTARVYRMQKNLVKTEEWLNSADKYILDSAIGNISNCDFHVTVRYYEQWGDFYMAKADESRKEYAKTLQYLQEAINVYEIVFKSGPLERHHFDDKLHDGGFVRTMDCYAKLIKLKINHSKFSVEDDYNMLESVIRIYSALKIINSKHNMLHIAWFYAQVTFIEFLDSIQNHKNEAEKNELQRKVKELVKEFRLNTEGNLDIILRETRQELKMRVTRANESHKDLFYTIYDSLASRLQRIGISIS